MAANGIASRIAIIGMGCTRFGQRRERDVGGLLADAAQEAAESARVDLADVDAFWLGSFGSLKSGVALAKALKTEFKPVTRTENFCATGSDAFRNACYAVAAGAYDVAMVVGAEKMTDAGYPGLPFGMPPGDGTDLDITPPGTFSYLAQGYQRRYGVDPDLLKSAMTHIAWRNHRNGVPNPRAQFRTEVAKEVIAAAPPIAGNLSLFDCGAIGDGAAAAIIVRAEDASRYPGKPVYVRGMSFAVGPGTGLLDPAFDFSSFPEVITSARQAYRQAGITDPRGRLALAEVHDCFTVTELILMEDLGFAEPGHAWKAVLDGVFDREGELPVNTDGGLKSFGHPLGASGIRMMFECWLQLRGEAGDRQLDTRADLALTQNLGGNPGECVSFVGVFGTERS
ncbi:acetyl-CoA acetyltransferase [Amycolatopsis anabasis]|uniref:acetyl-CoA acetyltransferase n=1 Tax=Amycolatopsis anabasis TaxID=1840409 RepID=UPI00131AD32A|nr:acetyl-CoA acetyltransferase [Amycolatopsis anabasis]